MSPTTAVFVGVGVSLLLFSSLAVVAKSKLQTFLYAVISISTGAMALIAIIYALWLTKSIERYYWISAALVLRILFWAEGRGFYLLRIKEWASENKLKVIRFRKDVFFSLANEGHRTSYWVEVFDQDHKKQVARLSFGNYFDAEPETVEVEHADMGYLVPFSVNFVLVAALWVAACYIALSLLASGNQFFSGRMTL